MQRQNNDSQIIESIKAGDEKLFINPTKYSSLFTPTEEKMIGRELELNLKERGLLDILLRAGSVDNIQDPILYRRVFNAIYEFCMENNIALDDHQQHSMLMNNK